MIKYRTSYPVSPVLPTTLDVWGCITRWELDHTYLRLAHGGVRSLKCLKEGYSHRNQPKREAGCGWELRTRVPRDLWVREF